MTRTFCARGFVMSLPASGRTQSTVCLTAIVKARSRLRNARPRAARDAGCDEPAFPHRTLTVRSRTGDDASASEDSDDDSPELMSDCLNCAPLFGFSAFFDSTENNKTLLACAGLTPDALPFSMRASPSRLRAPAPLTSHAYSSRTTTKRVAHPVRARAALRCPASDDAEAGPSSNRKGPDTRVAIAWWHAGEFQAAELVLETYLSAYPTDVTAWISYAQMQKKVRVSIGETPTPRLHPGAQSASDVSVSKQSVWRARAVLYRAIKACVDDDDDPPNSNSESRTTYTSRAQLIQALGLLELTHGYEAYGSTLLEIAVRRGPTLTPVLRWRRCRDARARHLVAGAGRVRKMRDVVRERF